MSLFTLSTKATPKFLKAGFLGFEGSGKTFSGALLLIGMHKFAKWDCPIVMYDTEGGSDNIAELFEAAGIEFMVIKSKALVDLNAAIKEANKEKYPLLIDSLTHPYLELTRTYLRKKGNRGFIAMPDWQQIKDTWRLNFSEPFSEFQSDILWCSRAKNIFEEVLDQIATENSGGKEIFKSVQVGVGARTETESAFEPSLLVEFQRVFKQDEKKRGPGKSAKYNRRATVIKDRFVVLDGLDVDFGPVAVNKTKVDFGKIVAENKVFQFFRPHIERLNLPARKKGATAIGFSQNDSESLFDTAGDNERRKFLKQRDIVLEEIENALVKSFPSTSGADKKAKLAILEWIFGTNSWTAITNKQYKDLLPLKEQLVTLLASPELTERIVAGENPSKDVLYIETETQDESAIPEELWMAYRAAEKSGKKLGVDIPAVPDDVTAEKLQAIIEMINSEIKASKATNGKRQEAHQEALAV